MDIRFSIPLLSSSPSERRRKEGDDCNPCQELVWGGNQESFPLSYGNGKDNSEVVEIEYSNGNDRKMIMNHFLSSPPFLPRPVPLCRPLGRFR